METLLSLFNAATCGLVSLVLLWAILSPRVHDGVVVKCGLIAMSLGFGSIALRMADGIGPNDGAGLARSILMVNTGIAVVIAGYVWRTRRERHKLRRSTDWGAFDGEPRT